MSDSDSENEAPEVPATNGPAKAGKQDKQEDLSGAESALADYIRCVFNGLVSEKVLEANLEQACKDASAWKMIKLLAQRAAAPVRKKHANNGKKKEKSQLARASSTAPAASSRFGLPWNDEEDSRLLEMVAAAASGRVNWRQIAVALGECSAAAAHRHRMQCLDDVLV